MWHGSDEGNSTEAEGIVESWAVPEVVQTDSVGGARRVEESKALDHMMEDIEGSQVLDFENILLARWSAVAHLWAELALAGLGWRRTFQRMEGILAMVRVHCERYHLEAVLPSTCSNK